MLGLILFFVAVTQCTVLMFNWHLHASGPCYLPNSDFTCLATCTRTDTTGNLGNKSATWLLIILLH